MDSSIASSSHANNQDTKAHQSGNVSIHVQCGGSLQTIDGVTKYTPEGLPKRVLSLVSPITYSDLKNCVKEKYSLSSGFRLFYKSSPSDDIFEVGDEDDIAQMREKVNQTLTVFVDNQSSSLINKRADDINNITRYIPLDRAIMSGNWEQAKVIFNIDKNALTAKIDKDGNTPLHIAIGVRKHLFVKNLLEMIKPEFLPKMVNENKLTALHNAAYFGNLKAAMMLVDKNKDLLFIADSEERLPIHTAIINFHKKTFKYLLEVSEKNIDLSREGRYKCPFDDKDGARLLANIIFAGEFDVAHYLIQKFPHMARTRHEKQKSPLNSIASMPDTYYSGGTHYNFWQNMVYSHIPIKNRGIDDANTNENVTNQERDMTKFRRSYFYLAIRRIYTKFWELAQHVPHIKKIHQAKERHNSAIMLLECICKEVAELEGPYDQIFKHYGRGFTVAVENDISEVIEVIIRYFPQSIWIKFKGCNLSQSAIMSRSEKVYKFLVEKVVNNHLLRTCKDDKQNTLLHLAGKVAPKHKLNEVSGAALQMQRELQWFKEVEKFVFPTNKKEKNKCGQTPMMVFRESHAELRKHGEDWMKTTANSYTITAALIITIAFAAAITVPGGNSGDTGRAIFERRTSFTVFVVSDAISLFTSSTSLLLFLSVLTARYREENFLRDLPTKLIVGLVMLFLSMTSMIVAFSSTLYLLFEQEYAWILIPIGALTYLPIASFITLQFPLLKELIFSTYGRGNFPRHPQIKE